MKLKRATLEQTCGLVEPVTPATGTQLKHVDETLEDNTKMFNR